MAPSCKLLCKACGCCCNPAPTNSAVVVAHRILLAALAVYEANSAPANPSTPAANAADVIPPVAVVNATNGIISDTTCAA